MIAFRFRIGNANQLLEVPDNIAPEKLAEVGGRGIVNKLRGHFQELQDERPNKNNWPRQNFWDNARRGTSGAMVGRAFVATVAAVGIALRLFGGDVFPVNADWLTIPARREAYGKYAREFNNLRFVLLGPRNAELIEAEATNIRRTKTGFKSAGAKPAGMVMFWLVKETHHDPDPSVLPTDEEITEAALLPMQQYIDQKAGGAA